MLDEASHHVEVAVQRGEEQRRGAVPCSQVDGGVVLDEASHHVEVARRRRRDQWGRAAPPGYDRVITHSAVAVSTRSEQRAHLALRAARTRGVQRVPAPISHSMPRRRKSRPRTGRWCGLGIPCAWAGAEAVGRPTTARGCQNVPPDRSCRTAHPRELIAELKEAGHKNTWPGECPVLRVLEAEEDDNGQVASPPRLPPRACPPGATARLLSASCIPPHAFRLMHSASHLLCPQPFKSTECDVCNTPLPLDGDIACGGWYHKVSEEGLTEGRDLCEKHFLNRSHTEGPLSLAPPSPLFLSPPPRAPAHLPTWPPAPRLPANPDNLPARESFPTCPPPTAAPQALCA